MSAKWLIAAGYLLAVPLSVFAGADKTAVATRTDTPPVVDGHLTDRCWDLAVPTTDFILLDPVEGAPATNQTVVKILYTEDQLYIGLFMADSNAENIDARVVPRDGRFAPRDLIGILLDTQHDHRKTEIRRLKATERSAPQFDRRRASGRHLGSRDGTATDRGVGLPSGMGRPLHH